MAMGVGEHIVGAVEIVAAGGRMRRAAFELTALDCARAMLAGRDMGLRPRWRV